MPAAKLLRHARFRPEDLLAMVADVAKYPDFIDLISQTRVGKKVEVSPYREQFEADAVISFKFLNETFRSHVDVDREHMKVTVQKPDKAGALKSLSNKWVFHELSDGTTLIEFEVDVRLKAMPLEFLLRDKFDKTSLYVIKMFETRAEAIFEKLPETTLDIKSEAARLGLGRLQV